MLFAAVSFLHPTTNLLMNQAEERRGERQTFELGAEEVRNRRGYTCTVYRKPENERVMDIEKGRESRRAQCSAADVERRESFTC